MEPIRRNELFAIAAALLLSVVAFAIIDAPPPKSSSDFAAWAQGVGTIAAVAVAAWVGLLPYRAEQQRQKRERRAFHDVVHMAAIEVMDPVSWIEVAIEERDATAFKRELKRLKDPARLRPLRHILAEPPTKWSSMGVYLSATRLERAVEELSKARMPPEVSLYPAMSNDFWPEASARVAECNLRMSILVALMENQEGRPPLYLRNEP
jgi:hypothetical protein